MASLTRIIDSFAISYHFYADDSSLYVAFEPAEIDAAIAQMELCIDAVRNWMSAKHLKMNDSKSEFILIATKSVLKNVSTNSVLKVGNVILDPSDAVKSLGVLLDKHVSMIDHVSLI